MRANLVKEREAAWNFAQRVCGLLRQYVGSPIDDVLLDSIRSEIERLADEQRESLGLDEKIYWIADPESKDPIPCKSATVLPYASGEGVRVTYNMVCRQLVMRYYTIEELLTSNSDILREVGRVWAPKNSLGIRIELE